ncbi:hypothetical protein GOP47_0020937 [Adiantum capillus-veneris]|uniref:Uncharacterized protein n=1 Tax=Adiantum capillus-veneris TaxID=13818 RepID=A0A9D4Z872_ADICA|nr:hypothetical protein GOP47_0020937 [Adiantum capillus-veneris]
MSPASPNFSGPTKWLQRIQGIDTPTVAPPKSSPKPNFRALTILDWLLQVIEEMAGSDLAFCAGRLQTRWHHHQHLEEPGFSSTPSAAHLPCIQACQFASMSFFQSFPQFLTQNQQTSRASSAFTNGEGQFYPLQSQFTINSTATPSQGTYLVNLTSNGMHDEVVFDSQLPSEDATMQPDPNPIPTQQPPVDRTTAM